MILRYALIEVLPLVIKVRGEALRGSVTPSAAAISTSFRTLAWEAYFTDTNELAILTRRTEDARKLFMGLDPDLYDAMRKHTKKSSWIFTNFCLDKLRKIQATFLMALVPARCFCTSLTSLKGNNCLKSIFQDRVTFDSDSSEQNHDLMAAKTRSAGQIHRETQRIEEWLGGAIDSLYFLQTSKQEGKRFQPRGTDWNMAPRHRGIPARTNNYERVARIRRLYASLLRGLAAAEPRQFLQQMVQRLPRDLLSNVRAQGVTEQRAIDLSLVENHMTPTWARINRTNFEHYYRRNTFRLPVSALRIDEERVRRWLFGIFRPRIAWEMAHYSTGRHIEMEVGIMAWRTSHNTGDPEITIPNAGFDRLFYMVQALGGRVQTIRVSCVFLIRVDRDLGVPMLYRKALAPQPIRGDIEIRVQTALNLLYRLWERQNGVPTALALSHAYPLLTVAQRNAHQNQPRIQIHQAIETLQGRLLRECRARIDRQNNRPNHDTLINTYNNVLQQHQQNAG
ncbi:hypothetical protein BDV97DRAFT_389835 [Delphinella strobiligena]|nr:hypothetical protein BDV97DRAFT_389835 [Delphinella strobiligena]